MTDEQVGPEDVAAAIRAHQAPSEVVDDSGAPAPADDAAEEDAAEDGAEGDGADANRAADRSLGGEGS